MENKIEANQDTSLAYILKDTTETPVPETEIINLLISIQNSTKNLKEKIKRLDIYVDKYFPADKNIKQEPKIRRII